MQKYTRGDILKEKIEALSNKEFEYEPPLLCLSRRIRIEAIAGQVLRIASR